MEKQRTKRNIKPFSKHPPNRQLPKNQKSVVEVKKARNN